jgi:erythronate-4-phosphate dehydrogenase
VRITADSNTPLIEEAFRELGELHLVPTGAFTPEILRSTDVLIVRSETRVGPQLLEGTAVRFVGTVTIGTDHVDIPYLTERRIAFASAPGSNATSVKEYIVAALLALGRRFGFPLEGKVLGVVGVGHIGRRVVEAASSLGMIVLQNDPPLRRKTGDSRFVPLDQLMSADIVTLHVPLTRSGEDPTAHLFNLDRIRAMKRGAMLINTSRGGVVETSALLRALAEGHLAASVLDVWENEPNISEELLSRSVVATPHIAGYSLDGKVNAVSMIRRAVCERYDLHLSWDPSERMPRPAQPVVELSGDEVTDDEAVRLAVSHAYDLDRDDGDLRKMCVLTPGDRGPYFSRLRSTYRIRREFSSYEVRLPERRDVARRILTTIGFRTDADVGPQGRTIS